MANTPVTRAVSDLIDQFGGRALPASSSRAESRADLPSLLASLDTAAHILEMFRRVLPDGFERRLLRRIGKRIAKIIAQPCPLNPPSK